MKNIKYTQTNPQEYKVTINGKYLCTVEKQESSARSYWYVKDSYNNNSKIKLKGKASEYGPVKNWDDTRGMLVYATFPLEVFGRSNDVEVNNYKF